MRYKYLSALSEYKKRWLKYIQNATTTKYEDDTYLTR